LGGTVDSGGNNTIMGNSTNQDPNGTTFAQKQVFGLALIQNAFTSRFGGVKGCLFL